MFSDFLLLPLLYYKDIRLLGIFTQWGALFFSATAILFTRGLSDGFDFGEVALLTAPFFSQIFICRYYHKVSWHIWRVSEVKVLKVWEESIGAWEPEFSCLCISSLPFGARATDTCRYFLWKNPMVIFRDCE